jgi:hypothetical protein
MGRPKGTIPPAAGKGRKKGSKNKIGQDVKKMVINALNNAGGEKYLTEQAKDNPKAFLTLVGKVIPHQVTGPDGEGLSLNITLVDNGKAD